MDWQAMVLLGAYHGINPGMGWLFAVALGMQQGGACGVWRALPPIALGHAAAVGVVLMTVCLAQAVLWIDFVRVLVASNKWRHCRGADERCPGVEAMQRPAIRSLVARFRLMPQTIGHIGLTEIWSFANTPVMNPKIHLFGMS